MRIPVTQGIVGCVATTGILLIQLFQKLRLNLPSKLVSCYYSQVLRVYHCNHRHLSFLADKIAYE